MFGPGGKKKKKKVKRPAASCEMDQPETEEEMKSMQAAFNNRNNA